MYLVISWVTVNVPCKHSSLFGVHVTPGITSRSKWANFLKTKHLVEARATFACRLNILVMSTGQPAAVVSFYSWSILKVKDIASLPHLWFKWFNTLKTTKIIWIKNRPEWPEKYNRLYLSLLSINSSNSELTVSTELYLRIVWPNFSVDAMFLALG